jgi:hypothetical protein
VSDRFVLHHEGSWFYYLGEHKWNAERGTVLADGQPMEPCEQRHWYRAGHEAAVLAIRRPASGVITGYRLDDPDAASVRYPLTMSAEEYDQRRNVDDEDALFGLYSPVTEPGEPVTEEIPGPWLRLDGEPAPKDGRRWTAELPYEMSCHTEYRHLFPGFMPGFREHMETVIKALPRVRFVFDGSHHASQRCDLEVTLEVPFDRPQSEYRPARNLDGSVSRSRKGRTVPVTATRKLEFAAPQRITGQNRAEAAAEWDRREAEILAAVAGASVAACSACHGTGYIATGAERYAAGGAK